MSIQTNCPASSEDGPRYPISQFEALVAGLYGSETSPRMTYGALNAAVEINASGGGGVDSIRADVSSALRRIGQAPVTADYAKRIHRIVNDGTFHGELFVAAVIAAAQCPSWCDDCCPDDIGTSPIHSGLIATITSTANQDVTTVEVRIERQDFNGVPGLAYVALKEIEASSMLEFTTKAAGELADAIVSAKAAVVRDQASPEGGAR